MNFWVARGQWQLAVENGTCCLLRIQESRWYFSRSFAFVGIGLHFRPSMHSDGATELKILQLNYVSSSRGIVLLFVLPSRIIVGLK